MKNNTFIIIVQYTSSGSTKSANANLRAVERVTTFASVFGHVYARRMALVESGEVETNRGVSEETGRYFLPEVESQTNV